jgi:hypothetical protein
MQEDIDRAVEHGWYEKAAKLHHEIEGIRKAKFMANFGDYSVKKSKTK